MKLTWTILKKALNKHSDNIDLPEEFVHQNTIIKNKQQITFKFNQFFTNIGNKLSDNVPQSTNRYTHYLRTPNEHSFFLDPVTPPDVSML